MSHKKQKTIIGWTEYVDFPKWGISGLKGKIDTGARSSALHVEDVEEIEGGKRVRFHVVLTRGKKPRRLELTAPVSKHARVRSSTGVYSHRYFIKALVRIGPVEKEIEVSLVSRKSMIFRMLIGRKALEKDFLIDVNKRYLLGRREKLIVRNPLSKDHS